jgi:hypothetical protein
VAELELARERLDTEVLTLQNLYRAGLHHLGWREAAAKKFAADIAAARVDLTDPRVPLSGLATRLSEDGRRTPPDHQVASEVQAHVQGREVELLTNRAARPAVGVTARLAPRRVGDRRAPQPQPPSRVRSPPLTAAAS